MKSAWAAAVRKQAGAPMTGRVAPLDAREDRQLAARRQSLAIAAARDPAPEMLSAAELVPATQARAVPALELPESAWAEPQAVALAVAAARAERADTGLHPPSP